VKKNSEGQSILNDDDRAQWIDNDEGLYNWFRQSRMSKRDFIRANRAELTTCIRRVLDAPPREKTWRDYCNG
jgi:hypothetical protein